MLRRMVVTDSTPDPSGGGGEASRTPRGGAALFTVPRLLVGLAPKRAPDGESSRSPTSPLDPKALLLRSPRTWDAEPAAGRGLVDALAGDATKNSCLLSPRLRLKSYSSLPKDCCHYSQPELGKTMSCPAPADASSSAAAGLSVPSSRFFFGDLKSGPDATTRSSDGSARFNDDKRQRSFDLTGPGSGSLPASITRRFVGSVSASEIEQSEDYTRIIARGPNPKTTHIFGDCILEPLPVGETDGEAAAAALEAQQEGAAAAESYWVVKRAEEQADAVAACEDFLSSCFTCKKKLEGNDIYIYRGEKAFCSASCRDQEILIDEQAENAATTSSSSSATDDSPRSTFSSLHEDIFMPGMVVAT